MTVKPEADGAAQVQQLAQDPALDGALMADPRDIGPDDLRRLAAKLRVERALLIRAKRGAGA